MLLNLVLKAPSLIKQLQQRKDNGEYLGDMLLVPSNILRMGEQVFLDDIIVSDVEEELEMKVVAIESGGKEFIDAVIYDDYLMHKNVYIQAHKPK